ncbi:unnamed protein product [Musa textilis]
MIFTNKGHIHRNDGIGCMSNTHQKLTIFIEGLTLHVLSRNKCNFCYKFRYYIYKYLFKKYNQHKLIWVPKRTINDSIKIDKLGRSINETPKVKWVPKRKPPFLVDMFIIIS